MTVAAGVIAAFVVFDGLVPGFPAGDARVAKPCSFKSVEEPVGTITAICQQPYDDVSNMHPTFVL
jgi:hypothetical protein